MRSTPEIFSDIALKLLETIKSDNVEQLENLLVRAEEFAGEVEERIRLKTGKRIY